MHSGLFSKKSQRWSPSKQWGTAWGGVTAQASLPDSSPRKILLSRTQGSSWGDARDGGPELRANPPQPSEETGHRDNFPLVIFTRLASQTRLSVTGVRSQRVAAPRVRIPSCVSDWPFAGQDHSSWAPAHLPLILGSGTLTAHPGLRHTFRSSWAPAHFARWEGPLRQTL